MDRPVLVLLFVGVVLFGAGLAFAPANPPDDYVVEVHTSGHELPDNTTYAALPPSAQDAFDRALANDSDVAIYGPENVPAFEFPDQNGLHSVSVDHEETLYVVQLIREMNAAPLDQFLASIAATLGGALIGVYGGYRAVQ